MKTIQMTYSNNTDISSINEELIFCDFQEMFDEDLLYTGVLDVQEIIVNMNIKNLFNVNDGIISAGQLWYTVTLYEVINDEDTNEVFLPDIIIKGKIGPNNDYTYNKQIRINKPSFYKNGWVVQLVKQ